ncbi:hypothetical protein F5B17DRAFT_421491 [Nemania serpens]|nr:hypothetical protein F5B17DRAFT_421491 [Nemania serpens]
MKPVVDWDKLAARAGFKDGATAEAYYGPLLNPDHPSDAPAKRQSSHDYKTALKRVKTETLNAKDGNKQCARKSFVSRCPYDLEDKEV